MRRPSVLIRLFAIAGIAVLVCAFAGTADAAKKRKNHRKPSKALAYAPGKRPVAPVAAATSTSGGGFVPVISSSASSNAAPNSSAPSVAVSANVPDASVSITITRDGSSAYCRVAVDASGLASTTPPLDGMPLGLMSPGGDLQTVGRLDGNGRLSASMRLTTGGGLGTWGSAAGASRLYIFARSSALGGYAYIPFEGNVFGRGGSAVRVSYSNSCS
ncbi:MAG: hypothetical protein ACR2JV_05385 [Gaiellales bacterium]